jgi:hypothetical protein
VITVRNGGHEPLLVTHTYGPHDKFGDVVPPFQERSFTGFREGHFEIRRISIRSVDRRFDVRGGDPYNRIGRWSVP